MVTAVAPNTVSHRCHRWRSEVALRMLPPLAVITVVAALSVWLIGDGAAFTGIIIWFVAAPPMMAMWSAWKRDAKIVTVSPQGIAASWGFGRRASTWGEIAKVDWSHLPNRDEPFPRVRPKQRALHGPRVVVRDADTYDFRIHACDPHLPDVESFFVALHRRARENGVPSEPPTWISRGKVGAGDGE